MSRRSSLWRRYGFDLLIVLAALEAALEVAVRDGPNAPDTASWFAVPATAFIILPLLARRRFPFAAPAALWVWATILSFVDGQLVTFTVMATAGGITAAFMLGNLRDDFQARIGLGLVVGGAAIIVYNDPSDDTATLVLQPMLFALGWVAGFVLHQRAEQAEEAEERATHAERERESAARLAVAEERARIARELHDVVAHAVSVMVLQIGAVRHKLPEGPEAEALQGVEQAGRTALTEMRRLLGAMRNADEDPELAPQPGLGGLESLVEEVGRAGLPVRLHVEGEQVPLGRGLDLSAYRIVQEGLTNVLKHARASQADVTVRYAPDELQIDVRDDGMGAASTDGLGHGLVGVRERVKLYGGEMTAGPAPGGGFVLAARLPIERDAR
jgi:signal transduction histidine kinase